MTNVLFKVNPHIIHINLVL